MAKSVNVLILTKVQEAIRKSLHNCIAKSITNYINQDFLNPKKIVTKICETRSTSRQNCAIGTEYCDGIL